MNNLSISGRVVNDIELKQTTSGIPVCTFTVAVDRPGVRDATDFLDCVAWRKSAEFASKYFKKGDPIEIAGSITTNSYEDRNGNKRKAVEILCGHISFPKQKKRSEEESAPADDPYEGLSEADVPF